MRSDAGEKMRYAVFAGVPGSGKTSLIKHVIEELKDLNMHYAKFEVLQTDDDELIHKRYGVSAEKLIAGDLCPDHYYALELPRVLKKHKDKDLILVETAGLCLRCSPYIKDSLGVSVLDITTGKPTSYGPILTQADVVAINKGDLISQAEREIFRLAVADMNPNARIVETNGLTGEGAIDIAEAIRNMKEPSGHPILKNTMPSSICGFCYGNRTLEEKATHDRFVRGKEIKGMVPNLNCGACGFKSCNDFIRSYLDGEAPLEKCVYLKEKHK
jgi:Ni2+-binding GTPase involved in maturation of urease and hydrogenase